MLTISKWVLLDFYFFIYTNRGVTTFSLNSIHTFIVMIVWAGR